MLNLWIIEDNLAFRRATERVLASREDLTVQTFSCCEDALDKMKSGAMPEVVLLDVGLPGMDGIEGTRKIKAVATDVTILVLTVHEDDNKIFHAICAGASGYLLKSEPLSNVLVAIDQAVAGGSPMNPYVATRVLNMFAKFAPVKQDFGLTPREEEVLKLLVTGDTKKRIADLLNLNPFTVDYIFRAIYRKLHVNCQTAAVRVALKENLV